MARAYRDLTELAVEPPPPDRPTFADAVIVRGVWFPGATEPLPLALVEGYEYRIRRVNDGPGTGAWVIERRTGASAGSDD